MDAERPWLELAESGPAAYGRAARMADFIARYEALRLLTPQGLGSCNVLLQAGWGTRSSEAVGSELRSATGRGADAALPPVWRAPPGNSATLSK